MSGAELAEPGPPPDVIMDASEAYQEFRGFVPLWGNSYEPHRRACFYSVMGFYLHKAHGDQEEPNAHRSVLREGIIHLDPRFNLNIVLPPEHGKNQLIKAIRRATAAGDARIDAPTSYHPEALVGNVTKFREDNETGFDTAPGAFHHDFVVFDDAIDLMTDPRQQQSRKYTLKALDEYPDNVISKPQTGIPVEFQIRFPPHSTVILFIQPHDMQPEIVRIGFARRFLFVANGIDPQDRIDAMDKMYADSTVDEDRWTDYVMQVVDGAVDWGLTQAALTRAKQLALQEIDAVTGRNIITEGYAELNRFTLRNQLLRGAMIQTGCRLGDMIEVKDVEAAYADLVPVIRSSFGYIAKSLPEVSHMDKAAFETLGEVHHKMDASDYIGMVRVQYGDRFASVSDEVLLGWFYNLAHIGALALDHKERVERITPLF